MRLVSCFVFSQGNTDAYSPPVFYPPEAYMQYARDEHVRFRPTPPHTGSQQKR